MLSKILKHQNYREVARKGIDHDEARNWVRASVYKNRSRDLGYKLEALGDYFAVRGYQLKDRIMKLLQIPPVPQPQRFDHILNYEERTILIESVSNAIREAEERIRVRDAIIESLEILAYLRNTMPREIIDRAMVGRELACDQGTLNAFQSIIHDIVYTGDIESIIIKRKKEVLEQIASTYLVRYEMCYTESETHLVAALLNVIAGQYGLIPKEAGEDRYMVRFSQAIGDDIKQEFMRFVSEQLDAPDIEAVFFAGIADDVRSQLTMDIDPNRAIEKHVNSIRIIDPLSEKIKDVISKLNLDENISSRLVLGALFQVEKGVIKSRKDNLIDILDEAVLGGLRAGLAQDVRDAQDGIVDRIIDKLESIKINGDGIPVKDIADKLRELNLDESLHQRIDLSQLFDIKDGMVKASKQEWKGVNWYDILRAAILDGITGPDGVSYKDKRARIVANIRGAIEGVEIDPRRKIIEREEGVSYIDPLIREMRDRIDQLKLDRSLSQRIEPATFFKIEDGVVKGYKKNWSDILQDIVREDLALKKGYKIDSSLRALRIEWQRGEFYDGNSLLSRETHIDPISSKPDQLKAMLLYAIQYDLKFFADDYEASKRVLSPLEYILSNDVCRTVFLNNKKEFLDAVLAHASPDDINALIDGGIFVVRDLIQYAFTRPGRYEILEGLMCSHYDRKAEVLSALFFTEKGAQVELRNIIGNLSTEFQHKFIRDYLNSDIVSLYIKDMDTFFRGVDNVYAGYTYPWNPEVLKSIKASEIFTVSNILKSFDFNKMGNISAAYYHYFMDHLSNEREVDSFVSALYKMRELPSDKAIPSLMMSIANLLKFNKNVVFQIDALFSTVADLLREREDSVLYEDTCRTMINSICKMAEQQQKLDAVPYLFRLYGYNDSNAFSAEVLKPLKEVNEVDVIKSIKLNALYMEMERLRSEEECRRIQEEAIPRQEELERGRQEELGRQRQEELELRQRRFNVLKVMTVTCLTIIAGAILYNMVGKGMGFGSAVRELKPRIPNLAKFVKQCFPKGVRDIVHDVIKI